MEKINNADMMPGSSGMDCKRSSTFKLELSEYGNEVPFKVIKLEQDEVPDMLSLSIIQVPPNECQQMNAVKNEIIDDEYNIDMRLDHSSETDTECEFLSDSDYLIERKGGTVTNGSDILDVDADEDKNIPCRPPTPEWSSKRIPRKYKRCIKKSGLRIPPPRSPYEAFRLFLNDEIIEVILRETNKYAASIRSHPLLGLKSRFRCWKDVTHEEMIIFLGLLLHTGTFRTNRLRDYWNKDYLFNWTCFSKFMKQDRFMAILSCLNFGTSTDSRDKIGKIRPIINNFNKKMTEIYYPAKKLFLANPVVLWNGRLLRQKHRDGNRRKNVIKLHMLAEPDGKIIKYMAYFNNINDNFNRLTTGEIVKELLEDYLGNGHFVYMNKCYSSWKLATELLDLQTYCTGLLSKKSKDNLSSCNQNNQTFFLNGVEIGKWEYNKSVLYISTEYETIFRQVIDKYGVKKPTPKAIVNYCKYMRDSVLQEQLMSYYPCSRKYLRWDKKLFVQSLQIYLRSAFRLYNDYSVQKRKLYYYDFRVSILKAMLPELINSPSVPQPHVLTKITKTRLRRRTYKSDNSVREVIEIARKKCHMCRVARKKEAKTLYECLGCVGVPGFCTKCFDEFHASFPINGSVSGYMPR